MTGHPTTLAVLEPGDLPTFKKELQDACAVAVVEASSPLPNGPIPSDRDLDEAIAAPRALALRVICDGRPVGGAIVRIDPETNHNALDLFFIALGAHGRGLGYGS